MLQHVKNCLAGGLALLLLLSLLPARGLAYSDVTDDAVARNVEVLSVAGILSGLPDGSFQPEGTLTRAQFTKMAVAAQRRAGEAPGHQGFTIFPDVKPSHWAAGFVNLAVTGEKKFIAGFADGTFRPDAVITFGEAVTILMRLLGYTDADAGLAWPAGYLNAALACGLTKDTPLKGGDKLTRAEAAALFVNLMRTPLKEGETAFGASVAAAVNADVILIRANARAGDGSPAVETSAGEFKLAGSVRPDLAAGRFGDLLMDGNGKVWMFLPSATRTVRDLTVQSAKAGKLTASDGKEYTLTADVTAYYQDEKTTYGEIFMDLRPGTSLSLHLGLTGKVEYVFVPAASDEALLVLRDGQADLTALTGGRTDYTITRDGETIKAADLKRYDVATYLPAENRVVISTLRLTGLLEDAYPNTQAPTKLTALGHEFPVVPSAAATVSKCKLGEQLTLFLTQDGVVAGAVDAKDLRADGVGIAQSEGGTVTVTLLEGLTLSGKPENSGRNYDGELVTVSSHRGGYLRVSPLAAKNQTDTLDVAAKTYGSSALAAGVRVLERVGTGPVAPIDMEDIRLASVPPQKVLYATRNAAGRVTLLVLDNVTGDRFFYGMPRPVMSEGSYVPGETEDDEPVWKPSAPTNAVLLSTPDGEKGPFRAGLASGGAWVGIAPDMKGTGGREAVLKTLSPVPAEAWQSKETLLFDGKFYDVAEAPAAYNNLTNRWTTLASLRASEETLRVYVDEFDVVRGVEN
jgi:hypothetical protein